MIPRGWSWRCSSAPAPPRWCMRSSGPSSSPRCSAAPSRRRRWCWRSSWAGWLWATGCSAQVGYRCANPCRAYGFLEVAIGLYAFGFVALYGVADQIFVGVGSRILERRALAARAQGRLERALLLVPTVLMGGTLPLLAAWLQKQLGWTPAVAPRGFTRSTAWARSSAPAWPGSTWCRRSGMVATLQMTAAGQRRASAGWPILLSRRPVGRSSNPRRTIEAPGRSWAPGAAASGPARCGLDGRRLDGIGGAGLTFPGAHLRLVAAGLCRRADGVHPRHWPGERGRGVPRLRRWNSERLVVLLLLCGRAWIGLLVFKIE